MLCDIFFCFCFTLAITLLQHSVVWYYDNTEHGITNLKSPPIEKLNLMFQEWKRDKRYILTYLKTSYTQSVCDVDTTLTELKLRKSQRTQLLTKCH
jgi:hypothetical protein